MRFHPGKTKNSSSNNRDLDMSLQNGGACQSLPECDVVGGGPSAGLPPARLRLGLLQLWGVCSYQITAEPVLGFLLSLEQLFLLL